MRRAPPAGRLIAFHAHTWAVLHQSISLIQAPTPVHHLPRLSAALSAEIWIKRDDLTGFGGGGNKGRKLEYLMPDVLSSGANAVVALGATQSNFIRQAAAACSIFGIEFHAVAMDWPYPDESRKMRPNDWRNDSHPRGNQRLNSLMPGTYTTIPDGDWDDLAKAADAKAEELRTQGKKPYIMPAGGSGGMGALGFVCAASELLDQNAPFDQIILASGSGGTQTGLSYGLRRAGSDCRVIGICTDKEPEMVEDFARIASELDELLNDKQRWTPGEFELHTGFAGGGYQAKTDEALLAQELFARTEGIFLDLVYTAKAASGLIGLARDGRLQGRTLFWHTGGFPAVFVD